MHGDQGVAYEPQNEQVICSAFARSPSEGFQSRLSEMRTWPEVTTG